MSQLGQFMQEEEKDIEGPPLSTKEDTQQKERLKRKNRWQMRPNSIAATMQPEAQRRKKLGLERAGQGLMELLVISQPPYPTSCDGRWRNGVGKGGLYLQRDGGRINIRWECSKTVQSIPTDTGGKAGN